MVLLWWGYRLWATALLSTALSFHLDLLFNSFLLYYKLFLLFTLCSAKTSSNQLFNNDLACFQMASNPLHQSLTLIFDVIPMTTNITIFTPDIWPRPLSVTHRVVTGSLLPFIVQNYRWFGGPTKQTKKSLTSNKLSRLLVLREGLREKNLLSFENCPNCSWPPSHTIF